MLILKSIIQHLGNNIMDNFDILMKPLKKKFFIFMTLYVISLSLIFISLFLTSKYLVFFSLLLLTFSWLGFSSNQNKITQLKLEKIMNDHMNDLRQD